MPRPQLGAAAAAFDAIAAEFDSRFGPWRSVEMQRRAVRQSLLSAFPTGARLIEIAGGTGEDALWLTRQGREVMMTDASPSMIEAAVMKGGSSFRAAAFAAEDFRELVDQLGGEPRFDGAYSVFAGLNCVSDLADFASYLARVLKPGAPLLLVLFGTCCPLEMVAETLRGRPRNALRRFRRGDVPARLSGREFKVRYHRRRDVERMFAPWFALESLKGIGVFVPPSSAEPWISKHQKLLNALGALDRLFCRVFAPLGDHVLYRLVRTEL
ncbi:MAG TPA: class I SAM-dependent methyltransferase [Sphingomicrobium sp.]|nr:class I SAM-dependent methyltransferase [Sphingomicrobium sp.]